MLKTKLGVLLDGIMTWRIKGTLANGTEIDAVLAEGETPGDYWWENVDELGDGATVPIPPILIGDPATGWDEVLEAIRLAHQA